MGSWTRTPPTEPGYYWWRFASCDKARIVEVELWCGSLVVNEFCGRESPPIGAYDGEWSERIRPPGRLDIGDHVTTRHGPGRISLIEVDANFARRRWATLEDGRRVEVDENGEAIGEPAPIASIDILDRLAKDLAREAGLELSEDYEERLSEWRAHADELVEEPPR